MVRAKCRALILLGLLAVGSSAESCIEPVHNRLLVARDNRTLWNDREIDRVTLIRYLHVTGAMNPSPSLYVDYQTGANCGIVRNMFRTIRLNADGQTVYAGTGNFGPPTGRGCNLRFARYASVGGPCGSTLFYFLVKPYWLD